VRLKGETPTTQSDLSSPGSFHRAPLLARIVILSAGVFMNFVLAFVLLTVGFSVGRWIPTYFSLSDMEEHAARGIIDVKFGVLIDQVVSGEGAAVAGIPEKSILLRVDGTPVTRAEEVAPLQEGKDRVTYTVLSPAEGVGERTFTVTLKDGRAGVGVATFPRELSAPLRGFQASSLLALRESWIMTEQTVLGIRLLFSSLARTGQVPQGITGIVGIAQLTYTSVQAGFMTYLRLVALLSLSLAILNVLPFPALDGGRLLFVLIEAVSRRPMNRHFEAVTNAVGFSFLILLILLITFYDILRLF
jgi:regulator of sigma E protease